MNPGANLPPWLGDLRTWQRELQTELAELPTTLRLFRESVANLQRLTQRLLDATEVMEQLTAASAEMVEARRRVEEAAGSLRTRLAGGGRSDPVTAAVSELGEAFSAMVELNPFLRRPASTPPRSPDERPGT